MKTRIFLLAVAAALWTAAVGQTKTIIEQQCWLDGNISAVQNAGASVDISALAPGVHTYSMRVKDSEGVWSTVETRFFVIPHRIELAGRSRGFTHSDGRIAGTSLANRFAYRLALYHHACQGQ